VITDLAFMERRGNAFYLLERAPGVSVETIQSLTEAALIVEGDVPEMNVFC
jgi:3-oxoacid CoA-transferase subunit B